MSDEVPLITRLLVQARKGDQAALDRLFGMCRNYLGLMARTQVEGRIRNRVDPSDLVQQTLLEAYRAFPRFNGATEGEWLAWLKQILNHNAADFVRYHQTGKRQAKKEVHLDNQPSDASTPGGMANLSDSIETPSQELMRKERELQLADAIAQLAPDYQEVIILRNLQRLPFDEVAQRMERSRPAAQMLWMRAIHKLQEVLGERLKDSQG